MGRCALSNLMFVSGAQSAGVLGAGRGGVEDGAALVEDDAVARAARGEGGVERGVVTARDVRQAVVERLGVQAAGGDAPELGADGVVDGRVGLARGERGGEGGALRARGQGRGGKQRA